MATKHLCDRCNGVVETKEEFLICSMSASNAVRVERQRVTEGTRVELCANCAVEVNKFLRTPPAPKQPLKAGLHNGTRVLVEGTYREPGQPGRLTSKVHFDGLGPGTVVEVWDEKIAKVYEQHLPEGAVERTDGRWYNDKGQLMERCPKCGKEGFANDEFLSPYNGKCAECQPPEPAKTE